MIEIGVHLLPSRSGQLPEEAGRPIREFLFLRYVRTAEPEPIIDLDETHQSIVAADKDFPGMTTKQNAFLKELGLPLLPDCDRRQVLVEIILGTSKKLHIRPPVVGVLHRRGALARYCGAAEPTPLRLQCSFKSVPFLKM